MPEEETFRVEFGAAPEDLELAAWPRLRRMLEAGCNVIVCGYPSAEWAGCGPRGPGLKAMPTLLHLQQRAAIDQY